MSLEAIHKALKDMDVDDDSLWTDSGLPRMSVLENVEGVATREDVTKAAPEFCRENPVLPDALSPTPPSGAPDVHGEEASDLDDFDQTIEAETEHGHPSEDQMKQAVSVMDADVADIETIIATHQKSLGKAQDKRDRMLDEMRVEYPPLSPGEMIKQHLKSENGIRAKRADDRAIAIAKVGGVLPQPVGSILDQAMAHKPDRRHIRPVQSLKSSSG